jgi:hypothetical protein
MSARARRWHRLAGAAVGTVFVAVISLPVVCRSLRWEPLPPVQEFRALAPPPGPPRSAAALREFPRLYEAHFNDHFGLRPALLRGMHQVKGRWLGVSTAANVLLGTEGWLYYTQMPAGTDHESARPFRPDELEAWCRVLKKRQAWLAHKGIRYVVFIPPDKQTVYPEHLPAGVRARHAGLRLDQLKDYLREHSDIAFLDVRAALGEARGRERLYHVTDSHWNDRGAFVAYEALTRLIREWFPAVQPLPRSAFLDVGEDKPGGDLAQMIAREDILHEEWLSLQPLSPRQAHKGDRPIPTLGDCFTLGPPTFTEREDTALPRAVVFQDSFMWALAPLLSEHFRRATFAWTDQFSPELVRRERPDVVIQQLVERKLGFVVPEDFGTGGE